MSSRIPRPRPLRSEPISSRNTSAEEEHSHREAAGSGRQQHDQSVQELLAVQEVDAPRGPTQCVQLPRRRRRGGGWCTLSGGQRYHTSSQSSWLVLTGELSSKGCWLYLHQHSPLAIHLTWQTNFSHQSLNRPLVVPKSVFCRTKKQTLTYDINVHIYIWGMWIIYTIKLQKPP